MSERIKPKQLFTDLPEGTVTFLFSDVEGSTLLLKQLGTERYGQVLSDQRRILRAAFAHWGGQEVDTRGDAFFVAFPRATGAVSAAVAVQRALTQYQWPEGVEVHVRMGLHTGEPLKAEEGYVGMDVHRAARIAHVGHGGQVLLSETTTALVMDELPEGVELLDLGRHLLKDIHRPEHIRQLVIEGLSSEFPPLKSLEMLPPTIALETGEIKLPDFLEKGADVAPVPVFVGRERELTGLEGFLDQTQSGQGGVVFIIGGPGSGKTALMQAFARQAIQEHPDLLVAAGKCNAYTGVGDPYLPFREILGDLTGDVETKQATGAISSDHAKRLWQILPATAQALVDHGPDLVEVFIPGKGLLSRASLAVPEQQEFLQSLRALVGRERATPGELEQKALFEQYLNVLCELASRQPLLILLDDLQWADSASLNLLFHLGRDIPGGRILLLCAYRPEEVALGRGGERHPLDKILAEFKRLYGEVWIDLSAESTEEGRAFVAELLNREPNRFSQDFREALFAHTEGHPLFTIELLREMQGRGDLVQDEAGYWIEGERLNWSRLPARVEGVIEARIGRLEGELREILTIASVEGEDFTAQVIASVKEVNERGLVRQLSGELDKVHRLIGERGTLQIAEEQLYLYRFRHSLFQQHIYNGLGEFERKLLHKQVGQVLETLYGNRVETILPQLALHFSRAGVADKAAHYALLAGDQARLMYAHREAIGFYQRAIEYLKDQGKYELAARTLMKLGLTYHAIFDFQHARGAYDEAFAMRRREIKERKATLEAAPHPFRMPANKPPTLDPTLSGDETSKFYIESIFSGLVELDAGNEILPDIASSWEISADGCKYIFHLRDDVTWSDGTQVTASDFVYVLKRTLNPATKAPLGAASLFYDILNAHAYHIGEITDPDQLGVRAIDELTLEVALERPASYFLHLLTILYPVPRHVVELHGEAWTEVGNLVSNGPFLLASYQPGESITLTRNPAYHGRFAGNLQDVELFLDSPFGSSKALERYEKDGIDILFLDPGTYSARHSQIEEYISEPAPGTYCVGFDTSSPPFDDVRVRRAFAMALDRQKLADEVYMGEYYPAMGGFVPPGLPGHSPDIALPYDPDQARHLLAQAGYPGGHGFPKLEISRPELATLDYLRDQLAHNLNIEVTTRKMSWTDVLDKKKTWNFFIVSWYHDYPDPDNFLRVAIRSSIPHWRNETFDILLGKARRSLNQDERMRLYQAADKILIEEAALIPCWYFWNHMLIKPWVSIAGGSTINLYIKDVVIEPH